MAIATLTCTAPPCKGLSAVSRPYARRAQAWCLRKPRSAPCASPHRAGRAGFCRGCRYAVLWYACRCLYIFLVMGLPVIESPLKCFTTYLPQKGANMPCHLR